MSTEPTTLYRIQVRYPEDYPLFRSIPRDQWIEPKYGAKGVKQSLGSARAALTRYRNEARRRSVPAEFRIVALTGTWEALDGE